MNKGFKAQNTPSKPTVFAIGVGIALGVTAIMLLAFALLLTVATLPKAAAVPLSSIALGTGALFGARYSAKKLKQKGYLCGVIVGTVIFLISTIVAIILNGLNFTSLTPLRFIIAVLMGMIGGISGINQKSSRSLIK